MSEAKLHFDAVVVGLGKTGLSCVRYLTEQGLHIAVTDSRIDPPELDVINKEFETVPMYLGEINKDVLLAADQIILSPGISVKEKNIKQAIAQGIPVIGDIELFCLKAEAPIIAITGSNGKSTVTTLVADMTARSGMKTCVGGNLGTPVLDLLNQPVPDVYVLELSSFQLETTFSLSAHASVVLNISPDHMDRYDSLAEYASAKNKIYSGQGLMVINSDDVIVNAMSDTSRNSISFSLGKTDGNNFGLIKEDSDVYLCQGQEKIISQKELLVKGDHNLANALASMALASAIGVPKEAMINSLKSFNGLEHRCQLVKIINQTSWYNDSKATNVGACVASIKGLCDLGKIILIAGGDSKGADLSALRSVVKQYVKKVFLLGIDANKIQEVLEDDTPCEFVTDMSEAVKKAFLQAEEGDQVLLAPACASLDMYKNYQERGDDFVNAVNALEVA